ncbi:MAG TPA: ABC transporter permease subunit [Acidimicrobiales bacterium]|nr:ABC transporter permease subunit [Acidimicrobiales bacterium]HWI05828.1 ABC transporter permease subunit [Acidimicrobiales bacterium]
MKADGGATVEVRLDGPPPEGVTTPAGAPPSARRIGGGSAGVVEILSLGTGTLAWELSARLWDLAWLPPLSSVVAAADDIVRDGALGALSSTAYIFLLGMVTAMACAVVTTGLFTLVPAVHRLARPYFYMAMAVPPLAVVPFFMLIWGPSLSARVATVWLFTYFVMAVMATEALEHSPRDLRDMALSYGGSRLSVLRTVAIPAATPRLLEALRIAVVRGIKGAVNAELIIGVVGVGRLLRSYSAGYRIEELYATVLLVLAASLITYILIERFEYRVTRWERHG